ncbi:hypothetical protein R5R35_013548 [Gryllus longicercus]|uniref:Ankyrin repeat domain-containing protein n=1 Tax=Gryllus longicercus TaxID=2509291 RepID=A0AAN9YX32_9ORTH
MKQRLMWFVKDSESLYASLGRHLLAAAHEGKTCYVQRLLEAGADPNFCAAGKWTPLHRASARGHAAVVCLLLRCGACPNATTACGFTPLHMAACSDACGACVRQLLGAGAIADMWARTGQSPLHVAAARGNVPAVRALVAAGASRCARDDAGRMPCDMAQSCVLRRMLLPPCLAAACRAAPSCSSDSCHTRSCTCE